MQSDVGIFWQAELFLAGEQLTNCNTNYARCCIMFGKAFSLRMYDVACHSDASLNRIAFIPKEKTGARSLNPRSSQSFRGSL
jgi:hypothetical protein